MSHGQSQSFIAATPLPRAMEYETASRWRNSYEDGILPRKPQHQGSLVYDVYLGICKHGKFAPYKAEGPRSPFVTECLLVHTYRIQQIKIKRTHAGVLTKG
uniref:Uncharacterized protein n=1 Tax=Arundo donax TaxID=35708 RepID=A0A0A9CJZ4_ARUDO